MSATTLRLVRTSRSRSSGRATAFVMLSPWFIGFFGFLAGPLIASLLLAFTEYDVFSPPRWVGLQNITAMIHDPEFIHDWKVTLIYGIAGTGYMVVLSVVIALLIFHARKFSGLWRVVFYFPALLAGASQALVMVTVWTRQYGLVDGFLGALHLPQPDWLGSPHWALPAVVLMQYWTIGTPMLLFLGARASVRPELYEAARLDGARSLRQFWHISLPMMSPTLLLATILGLIATLQAFAQIYIVTQGGPQDATEVIGIYTYREAFQEVRMGYGAAMSWSVFLACFAITVILLLASRLPA